MKALLINGSPNQHGCTYTALHEVEKTLNKHGIETQVLYLGRKPVAGCIACGYCRKNGRCVFNDQVNEVLDQLDSIDAVVIGSPVYYASPAGQLIAFLDRLFYVKGSDAWAGKLGTGIVSCRRGGAASAFDVLNKYFTISNMPLVSSQYWNQVHGNTPEQVLTDEEGMQTMRTLGENMAWLLKCIDAGRKSGVQAPQYEPRLMTNFIR